MACHGEKKENQRIIASDVYKYVSKNSSLSEKQVKECFKVYYDIVMGILNSEHKSPDMEITLPHLGVFCFTKKKGNKKGKRFVIPDLTTGGQNVIIIEKDEPDYEQIRFRVHTRIKNKNKEITKRKYSNGKVQEEWFGIKWFM